jgi:hypothetical protein
MVRITAGGVLLVAVLIVGAFLLPAKAPPAAVQPEEPSFQLPPPCTDPREPEPEAIEARATVMLRDAKAIEAQCLKAADGDWDKWQNDTEPCRAALKARISALKPRSLPGDGMPEYRYQPLAPLDDFPLFQIGPREHISYLYDPKQMESPLGIPQVVAVDRWLKRQGIDLIFVPVPKMVEIYAEHFVAAPPDGIMAPHVRRALLTLLNSDVETVDGLALFHSDRGASGYLYNTADSHWAPPGMQVMAKEIAPRIARYKFGARAHQSPPIVWTAETPYILDAVLGGVNAGPWLLLSPEQQARAKTAQATTLPQVYVRKDFVVPPDPNSPVLVIGNSYVRYFWEQLVKELNLLANRNDLAGMTTESFGNLLREPELLARTRVVVWVTTTQDLTRFKPLPKAIMDVLANAAPPAGSAGEGRPSRDR